MTTLPSPSPSAPGLATSRITYPEHVIEHVICDPESWRSSPHPAEVGWVVIETAPSTIAVRLLKLPPVNLQPGGTTP